MQLDCLGRRGALPRRLGVGHYHAGGLPVVQTVFPSVKVARRVESVSRATHSTGRRRLRNSRESMFLQASPHVRAFARRCPILAWHTMQHRMSAGAISNWRASSLMARAHGAQIDQASPRFRAFSAMTLRQRRHRRRCPPARSRSSSARRMVSGSASALVGGPGAAITAFSNPEMSLNEEGGSVAGGAIWGVVVGAVGLKSAQSVKLRRLTEGVDMYSCSDGSDFDPAPSPPRITTTSTTVVEPLGVTLGRLGARWQKFQMDYRRGYEEEAQRIGLVERALPAPR